MLVLLPLSLIYAAEAHTVAPSLGKISIVDPLTAAPDTLKKVLTAKDWSQLEKKLSKEMSKKMAKVMIKQLQLVTPSTGDLNDGKLLSMVVRKGDGFSDEMDTAFDELDYEMERKEIINEFKNSSFENRAERREARKEMKEDLKELKKDYKRSRNKG